MSAPSANARLYTVEWKAVGRVSRAAFDISHEPSGRDWRITKRTHSLTGGRAGDTLAERGNDAIREMLLPDRAAAAAEGRAARTGERLGCLIGSASWGHAGARHPPHGRPARAASVRAARRRQTKRPARCIQNTPPPANSRSTIRFHSRL